MGKVELAGEAALLFAEKFGREVLIAEALQTSPGRARVHLSKMSQVQREQILPTVRVVTAPAERK